MQAARPTQDEPTNSGRVYMPAVDIFERADELVILADMPGADAKAIDIQFESGTLTLQARVAERESANARPLLREYGLGNFHRVFALGEMIDSQRISAEYADGVLTLHLPKVAAALPRKVEVRTA
jgi:HSP20 family protein